MQMIERLKQIEKMLFHATYQYLHYAKRYETESASGSLKGILQEIETMAQERQPKDGIKDCVIQVNQNEMEHIKRVENELHRLQKSIAEFDRIARDLRKCDKSLKRYLDPSQKIPQN